SISRSTPRSPNCGEGSRAGSTATTTGGPIRIWAISPRPSSIRQPPCYPKPHECPPARRNWEASAAVFALHFATLRCVLRPPLQLPNFGSLATPTLIQQTNSSIHLPPTLYHSL